jgi:proline iminopeptidase
MRDFYPSIEPYKHFMLSVSDGHEIYVECCGNPNGYPILFVHGGPGAGCGANDRRFFDPDHYHIILFDQRGCGRSTPFGSLSHNTTPKLVEDMEAIRQHLDVNTWHLFGGSWGSTLSLAYGQAYPKHTSSLILRGIFLGRQQDSDWFSQGGATQLYPDKFEQFTNLLTIQSNESVLDAAYRIMTNPADEELALGVAKGWAGWELGIGYLKSHSNKLSDNLDPKFCWTLARHETHFLVNQCFLGDNQLLNDCRLLTDIPITIVHGRYDIICPFENAWSLHKALPHSELHICDASGHASSELQIKDKLIKATDAMRAVH